LEWFQNKTIKRLNGGYYVLNYKLQIPIIREFVLLQARKRCCIQDAVFTLILTFDGSMAL